MGTIEFGGQQALGVFDDGVVPWERVFMCEEWEFCRNAVERFAGYQQAELRRLKVGVGERSHRAACLGGKIITGQQDSHIKISSSK